jgi:citrate lyase subunit beta/citryl-CoA lyase
VAELAAQAGPRARVAVRVHPVDHPAFPSDVQTIVGRAAQKLCHVMIPKVESVADVERAVQAIDQAGGAHLPLHVLIESPSAVHNAFQIAAHPRVQSLSFGLMDFVSAHGGAIPDSAMSVASQAEPALIARVKHESGGERVLDQFEHPLVLRAKLEIAAACHANGKTPSHCVVTEFKNTQALSTAARKAARELGYTRMWSIHPDQIRPILQAFAPEQRDIERAAALIEAAERAQWAPISHEGVLHDRASYRYYWQVLERAFRTGKTLPASVHSHFIQNQPDPELI